MLKWVTIPSSRGSSPPRNRTRVSCSFFIADGFFILEPLGSPGSSYRFYFRRSLEITSSAPLNPVTTFSFLQLWLCPSLPQAHFGPRKYGFIALQALGIWASYHTTMTLSLQ